MTQNYNHYLSWIDSDKELHCQQLYPDKNKVLIGRSKLADIEVFNTSVSRKHVELTWHNESIHVQDLGSSFGSWIGNARLNKGECKPLGKDSEIRLGNLSMWYEYRGDTDSQELLQTCFHSTNVNEDVELSNEINNFRMKLHSLLQENFGDNTINLQLINTINEELLQLVSTQERRLKEQRILNSISHILNRSLTLSKLLKTSINLVSKVLNAERGFVVINLPNSNDKELVALRHFDKLIWTYEDNGPQKYSRSLIENCFKHKKVILINDGQEDERLKDMATIDHGGGRSIVVIPLIQENKVMGVIYLDNQQQSNNFDKQQIPFLTTYAAHTSIALHNTLLYKRAITDDLTQLYTRQHIDEGLALEIKRAINYDQDLSILIIDLDHFKKVNDQYGHTTGDQVLQDFSNTIKKHMREGDLAGRFGGEEFVVVLAKTDINRAFELAESIRLAVENKEIKKDNQIIQITVSIGVASYQQQHGNKALLLLEDADKALYQAKGQGRNQTVCFFKE